jgi:sec-independent protein translocase protein TatA
LTNTDTSGFPGVFIHKKDKEIKMIGTTEVMVISGVVILLFGSTALPKFARSIGKARSEFEKGIKEGKDLTKSGENDNIE